MVQVYGFSFGYVKYINAFCRESIPCQFQSCTVRQGRSWRPKTLPARLAPGRQIQPFWAERRQTMVLTIVLTVSTVLAVTVSVTLRFYKKRR